MTDQPSSIAIQLSGVELRVNLGQHPWEKFAAHPTRLRVDLTLTIPYRDYFEMHGGFVDYDPVRTFLRSLEGQPHVDELEALAHRILRFCFEATPAQRVRLSLTKPDIFIEMDGVGLTFDVARTDFTP